MKYYTAYCNNYNYLTKTIINAKSREALVDKKKRHVLQNFLVATDGTLSPAENVALVQCVEQETLSLAKSRGFKCIFTSNSSPLTQVFEYNQSRSNRSI